MGGQHEVPAALTLEKTLYASVELSTEDLGTTNIRSPDRPALSEFL